jgi:hypothetical protein
VKKQPINIFIFSITALGLLDVVFNLFNVPKESVFILCWITALGFLIYSSSKLINDFGFENDYFKSIFFIFILYEGIIIIRGLSFSTEDLTTYLRQSNIFWPFLVPLFVFFDKSAAGIIKMIKYIFIFGMCFLLFSICFPTLVMYRPNAEILIPVLAVPCGFLLLNATYLNNTKVNICFLVLFIATLVYTYLARRNGVLTLAGFIIVGYLVNVLNRSTSVLFKVLPVLSGLCLLVYSSLPRFSWQLTQKLNERLNEDSRSGLFDLFFADMRNSMVFGKGMNGTYFYPMDGGLQDDGIFYNDVVFRNNIENGYLQLLLSGGIVHIVLFVLVLLPAAFLGVFRSSNQFSKACGVMIFLWMLDMFVYGLPALYLHYILVWICVGICYKSSIRQKSNAEIMAQFKIHGF